MKANKHARGGKNSAMILDRCNQHISFATYSLITMRLFQKTVNLHMQ